MERRALSELSDFRGWLNTWTLLVSAWTLLVSMDEEPRVSTQSSPESVGSKTTTSFPEPDGAEADAEMPNVTADCAEEEFFKLRRAAHLGNG